MICTKKSGLIAKASAFESSAQICLVLGSCGSGSWAGRRPSLAPYVTGTGATKGGRPLLEGANVDYPPNRGGFTLEWHSNRPRGKKILGLNRHVVLLGPDRGTPCGS